MAFVTGRVWTGAGGSAPKEIALVYQLIGQIASNFSEVDGLWYLIFTGLMKETPRKQVDAIFFMFDSSASQRALIMGVADATYPKTERGTIHPVRSQLGQLNARTCDLAGLRNAAIHGRVMEAYEDHTMSKLTPRIAPGDNAKRRNPLAGKDLIGELERIANDIEALISDLVRFLNTIAPKPDLPRELQQALDKLGLQVPGVARPG
ncbi:MAG: hypothetical protein QOJ86_1099 [Bradyrhizobium sp.]|nr:hypothetical protein [Bradyrhizobium sp.]